MNRLIATKKFRKKADLVAQVRDLHTTTLRLGKVLGLFGSNPADWLEQLKLKGLAGLAISKEEIEEMIANRQQARQNKDFARSDEIRDELAARGIELLDSAQGTTWKLK